MVQHHPALNRPAAPVCSVCIANYNGAHMLAGCLDSVLAQDIGTPVEIIVHDDASTDDSVAFLRKHYPQVEVLASGENVGFCIANNRMVAQARGEFVLLLNNDAALHAHALRALLAEARSRPSQGIFTLPQYDWQSGELVDRGCLLDPFYNPVPNLDPARRDVAYVIGACLFVPRELWSRLGGFPEWIGSIGEDLYLCCRVRLAGLPVVAVPQSGYRHRQGASFGGNRIDQGRLNTTYRRRVLSERNKTAVMVICTPTVLAWPLLAVHVFLLCIEGAVLAGLRRDARIWRKIYWASVTDTFRNLDQVHELRRDVQATRRVGLRSYFDVFTWMPRKLSLLWRHGVPKIH
jgi:GT2 family glycosyltransferase